SIVSCSADAGTGKAEGVPSLRSWWRAALALTALSVPFFAFCRPGSRAAETRTATPVPVPTISAGAAGVLRKPEHETFQWFWDLADPGTRLLPHRAPTKSFSSIAAVGFGLTAYTVGAERGWVTRADAAKRTAETLRFLLRAPQGDASRGMTGY